MLLSLGSWDLRNWLGYVETTATLQRRIMFKIDFSLVASVALPFLFPPCLTPIGGTENRWHIETRKSSGTGTWIIFYERSDGPSIARPRSAAKIRCHLSVALRTTQIHLNCRRRVEGMPDFRFKMKDGTWGLFRFKTRVRVRVSWDVPSAPPSAAEYSKWKMAHGGFENPCHRVMGCALRSAFRGRIFRLEDGTTWAHGGYKIRVTVSWDVPSARPSAAEYAGFARNPTIQAGRSIRFTVPGVLDHGGANFGGPR